MNQTPIIEKGTIAPIDLFNSIPNTSLDENINNANIQGVDLFNQAIQLLNMKGFKLPYIKNEVPPKAGDFTPTTPYTPLPDHHLLGFVKTYMAYMLGRVEEDTDVIGALIEGADGYVSQLNYLLEERDNGFIDPQYVRTMVGLRKYNEC